MTREEFLNVALLQATEEGIGIHLAKFADICIKWGQQHPHWISVEDELPKLNSGMVVVATYKGDIDFMIFSNSGWHNSKRWCCVKGVITHWMPLPAPPTYSEIPNNCEKGGDQ